MQEKRYDEDAWMVPIRTWLSAQKRESVMIWEIGLQALQLETARTSKADQNRIKAVLVRLGWKRSDKKNAYGSYPWSPGPKWQSPAAVKDHLRLVKENEQF